MYKLVALDIDGTLLDPQGHISPRVRRTVSLAVEKGCIVTLATGRRHRSARQVAADLGVNTPLILYSGSVVYDPQAEQALLHRPLPASFVASAVELMLEAGVNPGIFQSPLRGERIYFGPPEFDDEYLKAFATHPSRADLVTRLAYREMPLVEDPLVVTATGPGERAEQVLEMLRKRPEFNCNFYSYRLQHSTVKDLHCFDLLPAGYSKAYALEWLARHHGLSLADTLVVGDGPNDLEMLRVAGLGVAMGNATIEVKAAARVVVAPNSADGVAEALERFVLA
ncbi:MAG TPA: HAD family hydrolase [Chloroflexia bacterium]|nr:HAD family hydrolase [Chloroflexia bacterium]